MYNEYDETCDQDYPITPDTGDIMVGAFLSIFIGIVLGLAAIGAWAFAQVL